MDAVEVIRTKRDGGRLSDEQIGWFIGRYAEGGVIADEQAAALAMAIFFNGMEPDELATWTRAMVDSGTTLDLSGVGRPTVDKHSTGGVGDKVSLPRVPLVAACGAAVPQLSGRGLGHTGGTLDKMESIPGWSARLEPDAMVEVLRTVGGVIAGPTEDLAPADRRLYALRDVTSTVDSIPLIASSIMSKKVAEGTDALVLDVKVGSGAFLVLGRTAGNALEVAESVEVLDGGGPPDLVEVTLALAGEMVALAGIDADPAEVLASGRAREAWDAMVRAQGGDPEAALPVASHVEVVEAPESGVLSRLDCRSVGVAASRLGAGRTRKEDPVSPSAGVVCLAKPGDPVEAGQPLLELHADDPDRFVAAREALDGAVEVADEASPQCRHVAGEHVDHAAGYVGGGQHLGEAHRHQGRAGAGQHDRRVAGDDRRRHPGGQPQQGRVVGDGLDHHAGGFGDGEVEVGAGHRVDGAEHLVDLVRPAGVPDPPVDRLLDLASGGTRGAPGVAEQVDELVGPRVEHFGHPVEDLAPVVGGAPGPARLRRPGGPDGFAQVLAGCLGGVGEELAVGTVDLERVARLGTREGAPDEELERLVDGEVATHRETPSASRT